MRVACGCGQKNVRLLAHILVGARRRDGVRDRGRKGEREIGSEGGGEEGTEIEAKNDQERNGTRL